MTCGEKHSEGGKTKETVKQKKDKILSKKITYNHLDKVVHVIYRGSMHSNFWEVDYSTGGGNWQMAI